MRICVVRACHHVIHFARCLVSPRASQPPYGCAATRRTQHSLGDDPQVRIGPTARPKKRTPRKRPPRLVETAPPTSKVVLQGVATPTTPETGGAQQGRNTHNHLSHHMFIKVIMLVLAAGAAALDPATVIISKVSRRPRFARPSATILETSQ